VVKFRGYRDARAMDKWWCGSQLRHHWSHAQCATPVDYTTIKRKDGSVSCVIVCSICLHVPPEIRHQFANGQGLFYHQFLLVNATAFEEPYYTWMNTGLKAQEFAIYYTGKNYLGHEGEFSNWPINKQNGRDISFYNNNNFVAIIISCIW
jgi:hypothetical protein